VKIQKKKTKGGVAPTAAGQAPGALPCKDCAAGQARGARPQVKLVELQRGALVYGEERVAAVGTSPAGPERTWREVGVVGPIFYLGTTTRKDPC
jgi:hypothetical protein